MSRDIELPDDLHDRLEARARAQGFSTIAEMLATWDLSDAELTRRKELAEQLLEFRRRTSARHSASIENPSIEQIQAYFARLDLLQQRVREKHGIMQDSVPLIREDRER